MKPEVIASRAAPRHLAARDPASGAGRSGRPRLLSTGAAALVVVSLGAGVAVGGWIGSGAPGATPTATTVSVPLALPAPTPAPWWAPLPSCQSAVQSADEVISYLIGGIRDRRLEVALQRYVATAQTCRKENP